MIPLVGFDTETYLIAAQQLAPKLVCLTAAVRTPAPGWELILAVNADEPDLVATTAALFDGGQTLVAHRASFDLAVLANKYPDLLPIIWNLLAEGKIKDTRIREKLLNLTTTGDIEFYHMPDGTRLPIGYSLADLVLHYLNKDIKASKTEADAWRLNYDSLDGVPQKDWPKEAKDYAIEDSIYAVEIYDIQEEARRQMIAERGIDPFAVEDFRTAVDFALQLMSARGVRVDQEAKGEIEAMLERELDPSKHSLLIETGILRPAEPPRPHKKNPNKFTAGKPESKDNKALHSYVINLARQLNIVPTEKVYEFKEIKKDDPQGDYLDTVKIPIGDPNPVKLKSTDPSTKFPNGQLSVNAEFLDDHWHLSPVLEQLKKREELQKLVTTELPRMNLRDHKGEIIGPAAVVHPLYDSIKTSGRTSSYADKNGLPSFNCQNVDPRVRQCFIPRDGMLFVSADYSYMELCTLAQKCLDLFGHSKLAEIINAGRDPHAWLGSQLQLRLDPDFQGLCSENHVPHEDSDAVYELFKKTQKCGEADWEASYKKYRTFAKPTGLGYPGGLGPDTFVQYAKATYGVLIDRATAVQLRDAWKAALPEMVEYFKWINNDCQDPWNPVRMRKLPDGTLREADVYAYTSPLGMHRGGADYCAAANGAGLQTPSAEGALLATVSAVRECYDPTCQSIMYNSLFPILFIHDEIFGEVINDGYTHERCMRLAEVMETSFRIVTPDVVSKVKPVLMRRWDKNAEQVFDANNRLIPWEPKPKAA